MRKAFARIGLLLGLSFSMAWARPATIFDYGPQLKLQDGQSQQLRSLLTDLQQGNTRLQSSLAQQEAHFRSLLGRQAELGEIRKTLNSIRDLRVELRMLDITCQRKLEGVLTPQQLDQWRSIQEQLQKQKKQ